MELNDEKTGTQKSRELDFSNRHRCIQDSTKRAKPKQAGTVQAGTVQAGK